MFENFKPLKISLSYKTYQKKVKHKKKRIMSSHTKKNMFEHFNLTNISPNKNKIYKSKKLYKKKIIQGVA